MLGYNVQRLCLRDVVDVLVEVFRVVGFFNRRQLLAVLYGRHLERRRRNLRNWR